MGLIAVTGATGAVGGRVAARLAEAGAPHRLLVRDLDRAPRETGGEIRRASAYGAGEEMRVALQGAQTLFLIPAAALLSEASGKPIRFQDETEEEAFASRADFGAPEWQVRAWVSTYQAIRDGSLEPVSPHVRELTGRDPASLPEYLEAAPGSLDHVTAAAV